MSDQQDPRDYDWLYSGRQAPSEEDPEATQAIRRPPLDGRGHAQDDPTRSLGPPPGRPYYTPPSEHQAEPTRVLGPQPISPGHAAPPQQSFGGTYAPPQQQGSRFATPSGPRSGAGYGLPRHSSRRLRGQRREGRPLVARSAATGG
ncbi:MAG: hypothetical protein WKF73_12870 [Nocardioidaceae bacterium]